MPGPEQHLGAYMLALSQAGQGARGMDRPSARLEDVRAGRRGGGGKMSGLPKEPFAEFWRRQPHHFPQEIGAAFRGGSVNIGCMLWSVGLWHPATREQAIREALWWFDANRTMGFELSEPGARVRDYRCWTLMAHPLALRWCKQPLEPNMAGSMPAAMPLIMEDLKREAENWLAFFWAKYALTMVMTPDGPMCIEGGARSQGAGLYRLKYDYAASIAFALPWRWRAKPHVLTDKFWAKDWEIQAADALRPEIEASVTGRLRGEDSMEPRSMRNLADALVIDTPKFPTLLSEQHIVRYEDGSLVVWNGDGTDQDAVPGGNTAGLGAVGWDGRGEGDWPSWMWSLPPGGGVRIRQKSVVEVCWAEDASGNRIGDPGAGRPRDLLYRQRIEDGAWTNAGHPLPDSPIVYHVKHGRNGLEVVA